MASSVFPATAYKLIDFSILQPTVDLWVCVCWFWCISNTTTLSAQRENKFIYSPRALLKLLSLPQNKNLIKTGSFHSRSHFKHSLETNALNKATKTGGNYSIYEQYPIIIIMEMIACVSLYMLKMRLFFIPSSHLESGNSDSRRKSLFSVCLWVWESIAYCAEPNQTVSPCSYFARKPKQ